jgi:hypothetical protein
MISIKFDILFTCLSLNHNIIMNTEPFQNGYDKELLRIPH